MINELEIPTSYRFARDPDELLAALRAGMPDREPTAEQLAAVQALDRQVHFAMELLDRFAEGRCVLRISPNSGLIKAISSKRALGRQALEQYCDNLPRLPEGCSLSDGTHVWLFAEDLDLPFPDFCRSIIRAAIAAGTGDAREEDIQDVIGIFERAWYDYAKVRAADGGHWYYRIGHEGEVLIRPAKELPQKLQARYRELRKQKALPAKMTRREFMKILHAE